jgi:hypothetical protein
VQGIEVIAMRVECARRLREPRRRSAELAHRERDFGVGNDAPGARNGFIVPETAGRAPQQIAAAGVFTQLCHRDAPQRQGGRVIPQGDVLQRGKGVTGGKEAGGCGEGRVHSRSSAA